MTPFTSRLLGILILLLVGGYLAWGVLRKTPLKIRGWELTLPSTSKIINGLVARNLVVRQTPPQDRRRVSLALTASGQVTLQSARTATQACLVKMLQTLSEAQRISVIDAMRALRPLFM